MLTWFTNRRARRRTAQKLYGAIVAQARHTAFYESGAVADSPQGRYELIVLHLVLVLRRLKAGGPGAEPEARALAEAFVTDMDDAMRDVGIGDTSVAKQVRQAAAGLYDRAERYNRFLNAADKGGLAHDLATGLMRPDAAKEQAWRVAHYVLTLNERLAAQPLADVVSGRVAFANPDL